MMILPLAADVSPEVIDRIPESYSHFVIPFVTGLTFAMCWLLVGLIRILINIGAQDRRKLFASFLNPVTLGKDIKDIVFDCLFHVKIWKRKPLLGYMHSAIAFGWFMLIVLGHLEVALFVPKHLSFQRGALFYPIFYRFFVWVNPGHETLKGDFFFFLMDFFLLYVLSGIALAMFKRIRSIALGMKHTTKPSMADRVALYSLWGIFPLRLLAESFTADLSGGSFLTVPVNMLLRAIFGDDLLFMPWWWAYSICLGAFFVSMPFSRYMHILTEPLYIVMRNAGLKPKRPCKGFSEAEVYACSSCGLCLDACPMNVRKKNLRFSSVYFVRFLRRHNAKKVDRIADKCLQCGKCLALCPVMVDSPALRRIVRSEKNNQIPFTYDYLAPASASLLEGIREQGCTAASATGSAAVSGPGMAGGTASVSTLAGPGTDDAMASGLATSSAADVDTTVSAPAAGKVMYFAGCMSHLTPKIIKSVETVLRKAGIEYVFADKDGGLCCGRPLMLAGKNDAAAAAVEANRSMIQASGCTTLLVSCPICLKVFKEEYHLDNVRVVHYTEYFNELLQSGLLTMEKGVESYVYHDPCDLGRGCGIYEPPREIVARAGELKKASKEGDESICCGGSLGSLTLDNQDRAAIADASVASLLENRPDNIVTACPLCYKTFCAHSPVPVLDIAELIAEKAK